MASSFRSSYQVLSPEEIARHEIVAGLRAHNDLIYKFSTAWYNSPYTFRQTRVFGHTACKIPFDLWILHDLFCQYRFSSVVEIGTAGGGTALWYATLMDALQINGWILSLDLQHGDGLPDHDRIRYLTGSSIDAEVVSQVSEFLAETQDGPILINLDSDHHAPHVLRELELYAPMVPVGSWLVVEDTNGSPVEFDPVTKQQVEVAGPFAAVAEYLAGHPNEFIQDVICQRYWLTMNPGGWLQRMAACSHDHL